MGQRRRRRSHCDRFTVAVCAASDRLRNPVGSSPSSIRGADPIGNGAATDGPRLLNCPATAYERMRPIRVSGRVVPSTGNHGIVALYPVMAACPGLLRIPL